MKIIRSFEEKQVCLFCGNIKKEFLEDRDYYYECDCEDSKKFSEIQNKISELKRKLPKPKFEIVTKNILREKNITNV